MAEPCTTAHAIGGLMAPGSGLAEEEVFLPFRKAWKPYCHFCSVMFESRDGYERRPIEAHLCRECAEGSD